MNERMTPFHCPYCGEEDLRPHVPDEGSGHGSWECRSCMRAFAVRFLGLLRRGGPEARPAAPEDADAAGRSEGRTSTTEAGGS